MSFVAISWFGPPRSEHEAKFHFLLSIDFTDLWLSLVFPPSLHNLFCKKRTCSRIFHRPYSSVAFTLRQWWWRGVRGGAAESLKQLQVFDAPECSSWLPFFCCRKRRKRKQRSDFAAACYPRRYSVLSAAFVVILDRLFEAWFRGGTTSWMLQIQRETVVISNSKQTGGMWYWTLHMHIKSHSCAYIIHTHCLALSIGPIILQKSYYLNIQITMLYLLHVSSRRFRYYYIYIYIYKYIWIEYYLIS